MNTQNTATEYATEVLALAKHLDCDPSELSEERYDYYGLPVYSLGSQEYAIGDDSQVDDAARAYVESSLWAFNANFILSECELPSELEDGIRAMQEKQCESCNDAILALVEKTCGLDSFVQSAIYADGRGHFLAIIRWRRMRSGRVLRLPDQLSDPIHGASFAGASSWRHCQNKNNEHENNA